MENKEVILHDTPAPLEKIDINRGSDGKFRLGNTIGEGVVKGRPLITPLLRRILEKEDFPNASTVAVELVKTATTPGTNQLPAIKELLDRVDGKVKEQIEVESRNVNIVFELAEEV